jgi:hypothetical protein
MMNTLIIKGESEDGFKELYQWMVLCHAYTYQSI